MNATILSPDMLNFIMHDYAIAFALLFLFIVILLFCFCLWDTRKSDPEEKPIDERDMAKAFADQIAEYRNQSGEFERMRKLEDAAAEQSGFTWIIRPYPRTIPDGRRWECVIEKDGFRHKPWAYRCIPEGTIDDELIHSWLIESCERWAENPTVEIEADV